MVETEGYGNNSGKTLQWILKLVGKSLMKNRTLIVSKYLPTNFLLITKGNIATLPWKNLADTTLNR